MSQIGREPPNSAAIANAGWFCIIRLMTWRGSWFRKFFISRLLVQVGGLDGGMGEETLQLPGHERDDGCNHRHTHTNTKDLLDHGLRVDLRQCRDHSNPQHSVQADEVGTKLEGVLLLQEMVNCFTILHEFPSHRFQFIFRVMGRWCFWAKVVVPKNHHAANRKGDPQVHDNQYLGCHGRWSQVRQPRQ